MSIVERGARAALAGGARRAGGLRRVVVYDESGECIVHGEAMSDGAYWIGFRLVWG
jgi:hypothetical protein